MVGQVHAIKRRVLPSGKVSFDVERSARPRRQLLGGALSRVSASVRPTSRAGEIWVRVFV
jgi:hypothetical protein